MIIGTDMVTVVGERQMESLQAWYMAVTLISAAPAGASSGILTGSTNLGDSGYFSTTILNVWSNDRTGAGPLTFPAGRKTLVSDNHIRAGIGPPAGWVTE